MILVLACCDLAVVLVFHPFIVFRVMRRWVLTSWAENTLKELFHLFALSLAALFTMTLERYLALEHPFVHEKLITKSKLMAVFVVSQLPFGTMYVIFELVDSKDYIVHESLVVLTGATLLVILYFNFRIFYIARTLQKSMVLPLGNFSECQQEKASAQKSKIWSEKNSTCLLAVVCMFVWYIPTFVSFGLEMNEPESCCDQTWCIANQWANTFLTQIRVLKFRLIFFYKNSALRRHGKKMVAKCLCARLRTIVVQNGEDCAIL